MKVLILQGSPKLEGNTEQLLKPMVAELEAAGCRSRRDRKSVV